MSRLPECQTVWLGTGQEGAGTLLLATLYPGYFARPLDHTFNPRALVTRPLKPDQAADAHDRADFLATSEVLPAIDPRHRAIRACDDGRRIAIGDYRPLLLRTDVLGTGSVDSWPEDAAAVIEATGVLKKASQVDTFLKRTGISDGVILATHVVKSDGAVPVQAIVVGINEEMFKPKTGVQVVSNVSCTSKAAGIGIKAVSDEFGKPDNVDLYTIHGLTGSQALFGKPGSRKNRAADSILPTTTNASAGLKALFPELRIAGDNRSFRVPERDGSIVVVQMTYRNGSTITSERINDGLMSHHRLYPHVLGVAENGNTTSQDVRFRFEAGVADPSLTRVIYDAPGGTLVEIAVWYAHSRGSAAQGLYALDHVLSQRNRV